MAKITIFVAHRDTKVLGWSFDNNLSSYLRKSVKISTVDVDTNRFFTGTEFERTQLIIEELEKGMNRPQRVLTVGDLKRIITTREVDDGFPITILLASTNTDKCVNLTVTDYEDQFGKLEFIVENDSIIEQVEV